MAHFGGWFGHSSFPSRDFLNSGSALWARRV
jgi:hypothetical protein